MRQPREPTCSRGLRPQLASIPSLGDRRRCVKAAAAAERLAAACGDIKTPALILPGSAAAIDTREREMANLVAQGSASARRGVPAISRWTAARHSRTTNQRLCTARHHHAIRGIGSRYRHGRRAAQAAAPPGVPDVPQPSRRPYPDRETASGDGQLLRRPQETQSARLVVLLRLRGCSWFRFQLPPVKPCMQFCRRCRSPWQPVRGRCRT